MRFCIVLAFLMYWIWAANFVLSQSIQPHAYASGGMWALRLGPEYYTNQYPVLQGYGGLGGGVRLRILKPIYFAPEMGLEAYRMKYAYSFLGDPRQLVANLCLFYTKVSPGLEVQFPFGLQIRAGMPILFATGGVGSYHVRSFNSGVGYETVGDYHNEFQAVRYPLIIGPEVNLGYAFKPIGRWRMAIRVSGFYGANSPIFRYSFNTPHNPFIRRIAVDLGITRLSKSKE